MRRYLRQLVIKYGFRAFKHFSQLVKAEERRQSDVLFENLREGSGKILVVSLYKCGTHLLINILENIGLKPVWKQNDYSLEDLLRLKPENYLVTHYAPRDNRFYHMIQERRIKAVLNYRDPRDACLSAFHWTHPDNEKTTEVGREFHKTYNRHFETDTEFLNSIIAGERFLPTHTPMHELFRNSFGLLHHPHAFKCSFEDLVGPNGGGSRNDQIKAISGLIEYLGLTADIDTLIQTAYKRDTRTFFSGQIGKYKSKFSLEQIELFRELHSDILKNYGYPED